MRILRLIAGQCRKEFLGTRLGNGSQMSNCFISRQTDAIVGNGDRALRFIKGNANLQFRIVAIQGRIIQRLEPELIARIGCVRHQLAQENLLVAVQGVNHQMQ